MFPALLSVFRLQDLQQHRQLSETNNLRFRKSKNPAEKPAGFCFARSFLLSPWCDIMRTGDEENDLYPYDKDGPEIVL